MNTYTITYTGDPDSEEKQLQVVTQLVAVMTPEALGRQTMSTGQTCTLMACSRGNRRLTWHLLSELDKRLSVADLVHVLNKVRLTEE